MLIIAPTGRSDEDAAAAHHTADDADKLDMVKRSLNTNHYRYNEPVLPNEQFTFHENCVCGSGFLGQGYSGEWQRRSL